MADPVSAIDVLTHPATTAGGASALVMGFMRWLQGKEAREARDELIAMRKDITQLLEQSKKHEGLNERVALLEAATRALHARMDGYDAKGRRR